MLHISKVKVAQPHLDDCKGKLGRLTIFVWPQGETIIENLENRRSRPYNEYRKLLPEALKQVAAELHLTETQAEALAKTAKWSQYAGCKSCPCSPGFTVSMYSRASVHVDITMQAEQKAA